MVAEQRVVLTDEDIAYLLTLLRSATQPMTTQHLIAALRERSNPGGTER